MEKNFPPHHILNMDFNTPFYVLRVPKILWEEKPEAYTPQRIGLGPLHHLRSHLYPMHNHKLAAINRLLTPEMLQNFPLAVDSLVPLESFVRACYDQFLDLDMTTLAWIFAIDGLYLLHYLKNYPEMKQLAGDVLMLENQIPLTLLEEIRIVFKVDLDRHFDLRAFLKDQSPLKLSPYATDGSYDAHLLHRMYHLIVTKGIVPDSTPTCRYSLIEQLNFKMEVDDIPQVFNFLADRGLPGAATAAQVLSFVKNVPMEKILALFKKNQDTPDPIADEIDIPSVSEMTKIAKITFCLTAGGIRDIKFDDKAKEFHLPSIRVSGTTEIVLRNLVAYEAATMEAGVAHEMAEYVDLMCGLIDSVEDVEILREKGILEGDLDNAEIARMFNCIRKSEKKGGGKTKLEEAIESMNREYSSKVRVKMVKYAHSCFRYSSVVVTIVVLLLLALQAFCSVYGCSRWFPNSSNYENILVLERYPFPFPMAA